MVGGLLVVEFVELEKCEKSWGNDAMMKVLFRQFVGVCEMYDGTPGITRGQLLYCGVWAWNKNVIGGHFCDVFWIFIFSCFYFVFYILQ